MKGVRSFKSRLISATIFALVAVLAIVSGFALHASRFPGNFIYSHTIVFGSFAVVFVLGGLWQIRKGLSEFNQLRLRLSEVREGRKSQVDGQYPSEVQPLVDDLNSLLELRGRAVGRAQAKAGDLAHGLKTPLAVLLQEAESARAAGQHELAATIVQQVDRMRRHVNYHLAQARAAASGAALGVRSSIAGCVDGLLRTLRRLHGERKLSLETTVPSELAVQTQREDLDEMLGNLLDNACKWAKTRVTITSLVENDSIAIIVDDDGPGLDSAMREIVIRRGVRADEAAPGSGLGLAIVRDLADVYRGTITLDDSPLGGLRARLRLPKA